MSNVVSITTRAWHDGVSREPPRGRDAVDPGHADVHQHDIRPQRRRLGHRLVAVRRLAHHVDVRLDLEDHPEPGPHQRLVVDDQHADRGRRRVAVAFTPAPGAAWPPARSRPLGRARATSEPPYTRHPFPHPQQPGAGFGRGADAAAGWPSSRTASSIRSARVVDGHLGAPRVPGVPQGVGQPLLHEPVRRQVQSRRQLPGRPGHRYRDRQSGGAELLGQPVDLSEPGGGSSSVSAPGWRRTPTIRRISASASRPPPRPSPGPAAPPPARASAVRRTADACTVMTLTLCPITSCSSRAIRFRSSATAWDARCSRLMRRCFDVEPADPDQRAQQPRDDRTESPRPTNPADSDDGDVHRIERRPGHPDRDRQHEPDPRPSPLQPVADRVGGDQRRQADTRTPPASRPRRTRRG